MKQGKDKEEKWHRCLFTSLIQFFIYIYIYIKNFNLTFFDILMQN
jgi:hypothetical protein